MTSFISVVTSNDSLTAVHINRFFYLLASYIRDVWDSNFSKIRPESDVAGYLPAYLARVKIVAKL